MHVNVLACGDLRLGVGLVGRDLRHLAKIALPELKKRGYDENVSLGSLAGAGTLGHSDPAVDHHGGLRRAANVSIIQVFLAGFLPGLLVMALYSGYIAVWSLPNPERTPPAEPPMSLREKLARIARTSFPVLLLIVLRVSVAR